MALVPLLTHTDELLSYPYDITEYEYEYEIFIALTSRRNIRVQGSTSIKIYEYQHTTNKQKH